MSGTRASRKVDARRTAAQRVQEKLAEKVRSMTEAVNDAIVAAEERTAALAAVESAEDDLRAAVGKLAELGETPESIAELTDLDVTEVRSLRRPKRSPEDEQHERAAELTAPGPRRARQLALGPPESTGKSATASDGGDPAPPEGDGQGTAEPDLAAAG